MRFFSLLLISLFISLSSYSQQAINSSSDVLLELKKLGFLGNVLYLAAHPDDENTRLIAWLENEKLARTAYLSLTRGDGGQNLIGTEKGAAMGILRTQELMEARKIDGGEQFFSRAVDFGYSKTAKETFKIWNKRAILSDVVWIIRKYQPDVIITRFPPDERAGHGHHIASAILAESAFELAASDAAFSNQLQYLEPWQAKRLLWNVSSWWDKELAEKADNNSEYLTIDIGEYNEILGQSYSEIAAESRSQHKSQGFGAAKTRGSQIEYLKHTAGDIANGSLFSGIETTWAKYQGGTKIQEKLNSIITNFNAQHPSLSVPAMVDLYKMIADLKQNSETEKRLNDLKRIIKASLGIYVEAIADSPACVSGDQLKGDISIIKRVDFPVKLSLGKQAVSNLSLPFNENKSFSFTSAVLDSISQPYWLKHEYFGIFTVEDQQKIGLPENKAVYSVPYTLTIEGVDFDFQEPVQYKWTDRVSGENYRDVVVKPKVTMAIPEPVYIFADDSVQKISVSVQINQDGFEGTIIPQHAEGWKIEPQKIELHAKESSEQILEFTITSPAIASTCELTFTVVSKGDTTSYSQQIIDYPHIGTQVFFPQTTTKLVKMKIERNKKKIGYIMGSGDEVPQALEQIGYQVEFIEPSSLGSVDLSAYDAIIVGIRAYNTEKALVNGNVYLLDYVKQGGNLIVQYNTNRGLLTENIGPYPFQISRERVTEEDAEVTFLDADQRLLNYPNKIEKKDFANWVQERGLYFADKWDSKYSPVLAWHDEDEPSRKGAVLVADYGKGHFIYTGISFFRQLPAGVPGAFSLLTNMIEY